MYIVNTDVLSLCLYTCFILMKIEKKKNEKIMRMKFEMKMKKNIKLKFCSRKKLENFPIGVFK